MRCLPIHHQVSGGHSERVGDIEEQAALPVLNRVQNGAGDAGLLGQLLVRKASLDAEFAFRQVRSRFQPLVSVVFCGFDAWPTKGSDKIRAQVRDLMGWCKACAHFFACWAALYSARARP